MDAATGTGIVLLLILPLVIADGVSSMKAGFDSAFWKQPLDDKLDHIAQHRGTWTRMGTVWLPILVLACAGMAAFTFQLSQAGAGTLAFTALGAFLLGSTAWLFGVFVQTGVVARAAEVREASGSTPDWLDGLWQAAWWSELTHILAANVAFVLWGVAMLATEVPAVWMAWTAIAAGSLTIVAVAATREGFPHLGVLLPVVLGVALLIS